MKLKHNCPNCERDKPWKPKKGAYYYTISCGGVVYSECWNCNLFEEDLFSLGNVFRTRAEAESAAKKVKKLLLSLRK